MDPTLDHQDFDPPERQRVILRGLPVAIVAHVLFVVALAWSLDWKRQPDPATAAIPLPPPPTAAAASPAPAPDTAVMGAPPEQPAAEVPQPRGQQAPRRAR